MKLNKNRLKKQIQQMVDKVNNEAINTNGTIPRFWQLYLDSDVDMGLDIVDTCATSQALVILLHSKDYVNDYSKYFDLICEAVASIVGLCDDKGAWPSAISVEEMAKYYTRNGDTAIGDNCFALSALLDAGFLSDNFSFGKELPKNITSLQDRVEFMFKAINWLKMHMADDGYGWYYTSDTSKKSVSLTTINVLQVMSEALFSLQVEIKSYPEELFKKANDMINDLKKFISNSFGKFTFIEGYDSSSIGQFVNSSADDKPSFIHTCKLINLILYNNQYTGVILYKDWEDFAQYIVSEIIKYNLDYDNWPDLILFEKYSLMKISEFGIKSKPIVIDHENYVYGIAMYTLINMYINGFDVNTQLIENAARVLLSQVTNGIFRCKSKRDSKCNFPIYSSWHT